MSTFKNIQGKNIRSYANNAPNAKAGEMWYNRSELKLKGVVASGSVTAQPGISRGTTSSNQMGSFSGGSANAMAVFGGNPPAPSGSNITEEFNGSGWASSGNMNNSLFNRSGFGVLTAGVAYGGRVPPGTSTATEEYDGSSWTAVNAMPEAIRGGAGGGPQTAGIIFGGHANPTYPVASNKTKYYDGTNWSVPPATMNTSRSNVSGCGTQTAALAAAGEPGPGTVTESYDGTSWTTVNSLNTARANQGPATMQGNNTSATILGGNAPYPSASRAIEDWDGTSWATSPVSLVSQGNEQAAGQGASSSSISIFGGSAGSALAEQYNFSTNTITAAAWASGGALSTGRESMSSAGTQTAALAVGGRVGPPGASTAVESYNGTAMSGAPSLNTARQYAGGCGTQTAAITYGNFPVSGATEEYDGSSWATQPNSMSTARRAFASFGIQTAALAAGGTTGPAVSSLTEEYNGTSWTAGGALSQARQYFAGAGIETSGLVFGGSDNPNSTKYTNTEEYGGSSWTAGGALPTGTSGLMGCGATQTAALAFGGYQPSKVATTVGYDGTAWSTRPSLGGATAEGSGAGTNVAALSIGGSPAETGVEEFTGSTETVNIVDITTS